MKIKRLCLANGDEYEELTTTLDKEELTDAINTGKVIFVKDKAKEIALNSEFVISFEVGESRKLTVI